ncbi:hypothetical protein [Burkholderia singularis]|uniref:hypothetical protein n=1 Tax=Burkholderia singularis TaxID=1503053 RepID=UPI000F78A6D6|nr:hypothetical protein [Burkholderia singularis]
MNEQSGQPSLALNAIGFGRQSSANPVPVTVADRSAALPDKGARGFQANDLRRENGRFSGLFACAGKNGAAQMGCQRRQGDTGLIGAVPRTNRRSLAASSVVRRCLMARWIVLRTKRRRLRGDAGLSKAARVRAQVMALFIAGVRGGDPAMNMRSIA